MQINQFQPNYNQTNYQQKPKKISIKIIIIVFCVILFFIGVFFATKTNKKPGPNSDEEKIKIATRKEIPNAEVKQVIIAGDFASAIVFVPKDPSQLGAGNSAYFTKNSDSSFTYIASGSYFNPIDLLGFGIPIDTQSKLTQTSIDTVKYNLSNSCNYHDGGVPGFINFNNSFNPDGWQIDASSMDYIHQVLGSHLSSINSDKEFDNRIICVNALKEDSLIEFNEVTFTSTFKLKLQFITGNGVTTIHNFSFTDDPAPTRVFTLDDAIIEHE